MRVQEILHVAALCGDLGIDVDAPGNATHLVVEAIEVGGRQALDLTLASQDLEALGLRDKWCRTGQLPRRPDVTPQIAEHEVGVRRDANAQTGCRKRERLDQDVRHLLPHAIDGIEQIGAELAIWEPDHLTLATLPQRKLWLCLWSQILRAHDHPDVAVGEIHLHPLNHEMRVGRVHAQIDRHLPDLVEGLVVGLHRLGTLQPLGNLAASRSDPLGELDHAPHHVVERDLLRSDVGLFRQDLERRDDRAVRPVELLEHRPFFDARHGEHRRRAFHVGQIAHERHVPVLALGKLGIELSRDEPRLIARMQ